MDVREMFVAHDCVRVTSKAHPECAFSLWDLNMRPPSSIWIHNLWDSSLLLVHPKKLHVLFSICLHIIHVKTAELIKNLRGTSHDPRKVLWLVRIKRCHSKKFLFYRKFTKPENLQIVLVLSSLITVTVISSVWFTSLSDQ